jgi:hypothetical protein
MMEAQDIKGAAVFYLFSPGQTKPYMVGQNYTSKQARMRLAMQSSTARQGCESQDLLQLDKPHGEAGADPNGRKSGKEMRAT